mgnify:CR=1 FL=1
MLASFVCYWDERIKRLSKDFSFIICMHTCVHPWLCLCDPVKRAWQEPDAVKTLEMLGQCLLGNKLHLKVTQKLRSQLCLIATSKHSQISEACWVKCRDNWTEALQHLVMALLWYCRGLWPWISNFATALIAKIKATIISHWYANSQQTASLHRSFHTFMDPLKAATS